MAEVLALVERIEQAVEAIAEHLGADKAEARNRHPYAAHISYISSIAKLRDGCREIRLNVPAEPAEGYPGYRPAWMADFLRRHAAGKAGASVTGLGPGAGSSTGGADAGPGPGIPSGAGKV